MVAVGNAIVDVLAATPDEIVRDSGLEKGTMRLVNADEAERLYASMGPGTEVSGGAAANTAVGIALLGGNAHFVGKVADDQLGKVFMHDIRAVGVGFEVPPAREGATGRCLVMVTPDAQRTMGTSLGVAGELDADDLDVDLIMAATWTFLEGYLWDPPAAREALTKAASLSSSVAFSLSDPLLVDRHRDELRTFCSEHVELLFGNEDEVRRLAGTHDLNDAIADVRDLCPMVAVTLSEKGSVVVTADARIEVPAYPVEEVIDTTGAGDLYAAGFMTALCRGFDPEECARLGSRAAAAVITRIGARPDPTQPPFSGE